MSKLYPSYQLLENSTKRNIAEILNNLSDLPSLATQSKEVFLFILSMNQELNQNKNYENIAQVVQTTLQQLQVKQVTLKHNFHVETICNYELVHPISIRKSKHGSFYTDKKLDFTLKQRFDSINKKCYGLFYPSTDSKLPNLLSYVHVKLGPLLSTSMSSINESQIGNTVTFYSIKSVYSGFSFGQKLLYKVMKELKNDNNDIEKFGTLSPLPNFRQWIQSKPGILFPNITKEEPWHMTVGYYIRKYLNEKRKGRLLDPVARFHLGNGAKLYKINILADNSELRRKESYGCMVNYIYDE